MTAERPKAATIPTTRTMTAADRCDSCSAQAYVRTQHALGDLLWCAHHYNRFQTKLDALSTSTLDERAFLIGKNPTVGEGFV
jgi:hypothetical protein